MEVRQALPNAPQDNIHYSPGLPYLSISPYNLELQLDTYL